MRGNFSVTIYSARVYQLIYVGAAGDKCEALRSAHQARDFKLSSLDPPAADYSKLNVDAAVSRHGYGAIGVICRTEEDLS